ncbi:carbohydrate ABC transporter permease [Haloferax sp. ATCC BAA-646]|uniref:carbohydrate ABC transporter permease n=1 Tax=Haloferax sp. ATCC BAA-646 TaxID=1227464 RepID=UPI0002B153A0|nr:carbohydrate ABC transporter permease [Haloferax sp. ATCC BAA-646]ELZ61298.1 sugar ABC transporter permease [Haloferax sp. ATCC BAA-646]
MSSETDGTADDAGPLARWARNAIHNPRRVYRALFYVAMAFFMVTTVFPFYWLLVLAVTPQGNLLSGSFLPTVEIFGVSGTFPLPVPKGFNPTAFVTVFEQVPFHLYVLNSFVLAATTTVIVLVVASLAGYVFGRIEFPGRALLMLGILAISYFPPAAFVIPLFQAFAGNAPITIPFIGVPLFTPPRLLNTPGSMIMPFSALFLPLSIFILTTFYGQIPDGLEDAARPFSALFLPLSIFILTTFYGQIPDGLEDAARVEGTTRLGALFRVIVPLSAPGVATAGVLTFISVYNEFFFSSIMATSPEASKWSPIVGGILSYQTQYTTQYNLMAAASVVGVIPVVILVIIAQERIVSGLTAGALKE